MKIVITALLIALGSIATACSKPADSATQSVPQSPSPEAPASSDAKPQPSGESQGPVIKDPLGLPVKQPGEPSKLVGSYTITEVQHNGSVTMIPHQIATQITFLPDGSFSRTSKAQNKVNFKDSGQFVIEGDDQLILKIVMSRGQISQPPIEKRHKFSLSEDGSELRMTGADGKVGVFRR